MRLQAASGEMEIHEVEGIYHMKLGQRKISSPSLVEELGEESLMPETDPLPNRERKVDMRSLHATRLGFSWQPR